MKTKLEPWLNWMEASLQGVAYWVGHRRSLYRHYPLAEAALVAEICNLIHANLPDAFELRCEVQYSKILKDMQLPEILGQRSRLDLAVEERIRADEFVLRYAMEVKRASAPAETINSDLRRLAALRRLRPEVRTFLFLVSEASRPNRFVTKEGQSVLGPHSIPHDMDVYRVRRTWKAAHAFSARDKANYACLIEVLPKQVSR